MYRHRREKHDARLWIPGDESDQTRETSSPDQGNPRTVERAKHGARVVMALTVLSMSAACLDTTGDVVGSTSPTTLALATTTTSPITTTSSMVETATTASAFQELAAGALITPTGVVVAILDRGNTGFIVRTPCDNTATVGNGEPVGQVAVVLDPGHGGPIDSGAVGSNGLREADANLTLALATERLLVERGISVILTRTADYAVRIGVRSQLADDLGAQIMVSIHHNAPTPGPSTAPGTEIFVQSDSERSRRLGGLIWERVVDALSGIEDVEWSAAPDSGVLQVINSSGEDAYGMVRLPETVSVLAELAYVSSPSEAEMIATPEYIEIASTALADAIEAYLEANDLGAGYVDEPRFFNPLPGISAGSCEDPTLG